MPRWRPTTIRPCSNALPIAAAIVGLTSRGILKLIDRNPRFDEVIALTGDAAMMSGDFRDCTHLQIAQLMMAFLADFDSPSELDFSDGEGVGARHFRIKLAPLQRDEEKDRPRCLVCLVDRTVEVQSERTLRAEMLRDSLTGLPNRLGFSETIEAVGAADATSIGARRTRLRRARRAGRRHAALQPHQREHGLDGRRRTADHLRPPADLGASGGRRAGADRRQ